MNRVFVDTSAWYALIDGRDPDHGGVLAALKAHEKRLVTTNFVFDETVTQYLPTEDIILAAQMMAFRLIGLAGR